jgi:hypothetical protein
MWECEFDRDTLPKHPELRNNPLVEHAPLNTRDALYGGRTDSMSLHKKIEEGQETIEYCDVMFLYPYICKYGKFPIGHPVIYAGDECRDVAAMLKKEGLIKCCVMPPKKLFRPVLPYRFNQKLLFCLCRTCAEKFNMATECTHTEVKERALTGTWVMDEVRLAVQKGYKVTEVYEVYEYETTQYDPQSRDGGLFVDYINTFFCSKQRLAASQSWSKPAKMKKAISKLFTRVKAYN